MKSKNKKVERCTGPRVGNVFGPNIAEVIRDPSSVRFCDFFSSHFCFEFFSSLNLKKGTPREWRFWLAHCRLAVSDVFDSHNAVFENHFLSTNWFWTIKIKRVTFLDQTMKKYEQNQRKKYEQLWSSCIVNIWLSKCPLALYWNKSILTRNRVYCCWGTRPSNPLPMIAFVMVGF